MAQLERPQSQRYVDTSKTPQLDRPQSQRYAETPKIPQLERPHSQRNADTLKAPSTIHTMEQLLRAGEASKSKHSPIYSPSSASSPSTPFFQRLRHHDQEEDHGQNQKKSVLSKVKEKAKKLRHSLSKKKHDDGNVSSPQSTTGVESDAGVEEDAEYLGAPMYQSEKAPAGYKETVRQQQPKANPVTPEKHVMSSNDKHIVEQDQEKALNRSLSKRTTQHATARTTTTPTSPTSPTTLTAIPSTTTTITAAAAALSSPNKTSTTLSSPNKISTTLSSPIKTSTTLSSPNKTITTIPSPNKTSTTLPSPNKTSTTLSSPKTTTTLSIPKTSTILSSPKTSTTLSSQNKTSTPLSSPNKTSTTLSSSKTSTTLPSPNKTSAKTVAEKLKPVYVGGSDAANSITSKIEGLTVSKPTEHHHHHASSSTVTPMKTNKISLSVAASRTPPAKVPSQSPYSNTMQISSSAPVTPARSGKNTSPTGQIWDKGVSVKEYLMNKLEPGEDEKALSQVISEAMSPRRTPGDAGVMEKVREAVTSLLRNEEPTKYAETTTPTTRISSSQIPASTNTPRASSQIPLSSNAQEVVQEENHGRILQAN